MNGNRIELDSNTVKSTLNEFKGEMEKMSTLLSEIEESNKNAKQIWEGDASDYVLGELETFKALFNEMKMKNVTYASFIANVINAYAQETRSEIKTVEENVDSFNLTNSRI